MSLLTIMVLINILFSFIIIFFVMRNSTEGVTKRIESLFRNYGDVSRNELRTEMKTVREEIAGALKDNRMELSAAMEALRRSTGEGLERFNISQSGQSERLNKTIGELQAKVITVVNQGLKEIQDKNEIKLEQMRKTVDEKLHETLENRLTQSFETVTKQLLEVQKGLSEMQSLAQDVGGLKKVLSNVKNRGILGEAQLSAILEQFLSPEQYEANVRVKPRSRENVEYAVKLPGAEEKTFVWLPIDSKFPIEDYQRLTDAYEAGDKESIDISAKALESRLVGQARDIREKYIDPPNSTDFALMFLPFEGLYAEALRRPGLFEKLQRDYKVTIVGPTTLTAFLNSLQVGFKTLAISKQSGEVWKVLGAVKTEFGKFGDSLQAVHSNLESASNKLSQVSNRAKQMERKLEKVSSLPAGEAALLIGEAASGNDETNLF